MSQCKTFFYFFFTCKVLRRVSSRQNTLYVLTVTIVHSSLLVGGGKEVRMGKEEDLEVGAMVSSTVPCHATQYSWPKKLKKSQPPALPLYPLSRTSLEQRPGLRPLT